MNELSMQLEQVRAELAQLDNNNRDHLGRISNLKAREVELQAQIETAKKHEQIKVEHEAMVQAAQENNAYALDNLTYEGIEMRLMCSDEDSYQMMRTAVQQLLDSQSEKFIRELTLQKESHIEALRAADEREIQLERQNEELQDKIEAVMAENNELRSKWAQAILERDEAREYRDNAAKQLDEANEEIRRLNEKVDEQRKELALGVRGEMKVVDQQAQAKEALEKWKASRIKVTNIRWENDIKKTHKLAELVVDCDKGNQGETIRFHYFEEGQYWNCSEQEVHRFRLEAEEVKRADADRALADAAKSVTEVPPFQIPDVQSADGGNVLHSPVEGKDVTRAEFEEIKARVERIEQQFGITRKAS